MLLMMKQFAVPMKILVVLASVVAFVELVDAGASPPQVTVSFLPFVLERWRRQCSFVTHSLLK
jgi:hypothetical protein